MYFERIKRCWPSWRHIVPRSLRGTVEARLPQIDRWLLRGQSWARQKRKLATVASFTVAFVASIWWCSYLQHAIAPYFTEADRLDLLRNLFLTIGGTLTGAGAITVSVLLFSMQINIERMPHTLFSRISFDLRLLSAFGAVILLSIAVASLSIVLEPRMVAASLLAGAWGILAVMALLLYGYKRSLQLVSSTTHLRFIFDSVERDMGWWHKRIQRRTKRDLEPNEERDNPEETHDIPRLQFFEANPAWANNLRTCIGHVVGFSRSYAQSGDYEVADVALTSLQAMVARYVDIKGKTFFTSPPFIDDPRSTDAVVNDTLEHLRQSIRIALSRGDERNIEQNLRCLASLVNILAEIEYGPPNASKFHAQLSASYLGNAVETVASHPMPDVLMEGVRLLAVAAEVLLRRSSPESTVPLIEKIALIACVGSAKVEHRPVTQSAMKGLARLTVQLLMDQSGHDIHYPATQLHSHAGMVARLYLQVPNLGPLEIQTYLAPYYSAAQFDTLLVILANVVNQLINAEPESEQAQRICRNLERWATDQHENDKDLLLLSLEKRSHFALDIVHWISQLSRLLLAAASSPACPAPTAERLRRSARSHISVVSWLPDDAQIMIFVGTFRIDDQLFETAREALLREAPDVAMLIRELLIGFAFKTGRHGDRWRQMEKGLRAAALLSIDLAEDGDAGLIDYLSRMVADEQQMPALEVCSSVSRRLRQKADRLGIRDHGMGIIDAATDRAPREGLGPLLHEIAELLDPEDGVQTT